MELGLSQSLGTAAWTHNYFCWSSRIMQTRTNPECNICSSPSFYVQKGKENKMAKAPLGLNDTSAGIVRSLSDTKWFCKSRLHGMASSHSTCFNVEGTDDYFPFSFRAHHEETPRSLRLPLGLEPAAECTDWKKVRRCFWMHRHVLGTLNLMRQCNIAWAALLLSVLRKVNPYSNPR